MLKNLNSSIKMKRILYFTNTEHLIEFFLVLPCKKV